MRRRRTDATVWTARAEAATDPAERDQHRMAAEAARHETERLAPLVEELEIADAARAAWLVETAVTRDKAERSRLAAGLRGIDLDDPAERITAQDWLDADHAARRTEDDHRAITEHDLAGSVEDHLALDDICPALAEPAAADIRDTAALDATESADP